MIPKTPNIFDYICDKDLILPSSTAHQGLHVPEIIMTYGSIKNKLIDDKSTIPTLMRCLLESKKSYNRIKFIKNSKKEIQKESLEQLETYMTSLGISSIGYTKVPNHLIFKEKAILFPNAIVILMPMKKSEIDTAPSSKASKEIFRTYKELGIIVNKVVKFLNKKGHNAQAGPALGGDVNYPMLAEKAGLGLVGKHGLLINELDGSSLRIATIYTDINNFNFTDSQDYQWIRKVCDSCKKCVKACPGQAIYDENIVFEDGSQACIDYKKCAIPFSKDHGCTLCVKNCLFYKGNFNKLKEHYASIWNG